MKNFKLIFLIVFTIIGANTYSQKKGGSFDINKDIYADYYSIINSNRPGFSMSAYNVGVQYLQFEAGLQSNPYWGDVQSYVNTGLDFSVRYGIRSYFEIYANVSPNMDFTKIADTTLTNFAVSPAVFGASYRFNENEGGIPATAISVNYGQYVSGSDKYGDFEAIFITQNSLGKNITLISNWKLSQPIKNLNVSYILTLSSTFSKYFVWFVENIGKKGFSDYNSDFVETIHGGIGYLVSNDLQLDVFGGYDYNFNGNSAYYLSAGISYRIDMRRRKFNKPVDVSRAKKY